MLIAALTAYMLIGLFTMCIIAASAGREKLVGFDSFLVVMFVVCLIGGICWPISLPRELLELWKLRKES